MLSHLGKKQWCFKVNFSGGYWSPVLGPRHIKVAERAFFTSVWLVETWIFQDVDPEEERDLVEERMWSGKVYMWYTRHMSSLTHLLMCPWEAPGKMALILLYQWPLPNTVVTHSYLSLTILTHLTPQILTAWLAHSFPSPGYPDFHLEHGFSFLFVLWKHKTQKLAAYLLCPSAQNPDWSW